jgi:hypothetical protein
MKITDRKGFDEVFKSTPQVVQSQESLYDQLVLLQGVANRFGLYDAADYIQRKLNEHNSSHYT